MRLPLRPCLRLLHRLLLLLAVAAALGAPAFAASTLMPATADARPCHGGGPATVHADHARMAEPAPASGAGHVQPICCALACLAALPPQAPTLALAGHVRPLWEALPAAPLRGRAPPIPVPPPRAIS